METDRIEITTPEGLTLDMTLAGVGSRSAAGVIDTLIILLITFAVFLPLRNSEPPTPVRIALLLLPVALFFGYHLAFETTGRRQSPGKRMLRLRVVRADGSPVGFVASLIRNLIRIVDFLPVAYLVGLATVFSSSRNQRLGDLAAGVVVVVEPASVPAVELAAPAMSADLPEGWDVSAVTDQDLAVLRQFLSRRASLAHVPRGEIAQGLAARLEPKVSRPPHLLSNEQLIETVVRIKDSED